MDRRKFLSMTTVTGTALAAGCGGSTDSSSPTGEAGTDSGSTDTPSGSTTGSFRLLISDRPADIDDFDSLDVTFDRARVHRRQSDGEADETEDGTAEATATETETATATGTDAEDGTDDEDDAEGGFTVFDLDSPTVDLTQVVGEKAIGVLDGKLETGEYSKIELYVSDVNGVVDGESVDVTVPSNKLQITKPFEITADEPIEFVFDINVVKKGNGGYNLLPVISESGVAGKDVDVEEVDPADETDEDSTDEETSTGETTAAESGTGTQTAD
ncbi:DUF4382 domain-containing protein [Haloarcula sediminis]|uniref:DUF4382 domain-containing protein n=1 Tax=Haloarcula sediminis TaxID=3111777 RepID=UPI002D76598F|nr:DUF4382 domain-containing protein [Haloarcula sp. CK38]